MNTAIRLAYLLRLLFGNSLNKLMLATAVVLLLPALDPASRATAHAEWDASPLSYAGFAMNDLRARIHAWTAP